MKARAWKRSVPTGGLSARLTARRARGILPRRVVDAAPSSATGGRRKRIAPPRAGMSADSIHELASA
jgi:hypothetical protein